MKSKKSSGKRALKDLSVRKGQEVKGGETCKPTLASSVIKKNNDAGAAVISKI